VTRRRKKHTKPHLSAPLISEGKREQYFFLPLTIILTAVAYKLTLCPTVYVGDSGELSVAAYYLGIPHAPGYPLYCLIGWLFAHAPIAGDIAYRMNIMSAFFSLGTVVVLYLIIYHFTRTPYLSFSISLAYAFSPIFWSQATVAEVYSLNTFLTALALYFLCRWIEKRAVSWLYLAGFTSGIAVANHQLALLLLPTGAYMLWLFGKGLTRNVRFWITLAALYIFGLLIYLYLPIRAAANPPLNWGDPDSLGAFIDTVFKPAGEQTSGGSRWEHFIYVLRLWIFQFSPIVYIRGEGWPIPIIWAFGIWGTYKGLSTGWRMARVFILFILLNVGVILFVSRPARSELLLVGVYYLPVFLVFAVFIATGIREWLQQFLHTFGEQRRPILLGLVILILVLIPEYQFFQNRPEADRSGDYYAQDYGTALLNNCPPDSILLVNWDDIFILWYIQKVEHVRPDVIAVLADFPVNPSAYYWGSWYIEELNEKHPEIFEGSGFDSTTFLSREEALESFVTANLARGREVYFSFYGLGYDFDMFDGFLVYPLGPVYEARLERAYTLADVLQAQQAWERTLDDFRNIYTYRDRRIEEEDFIIARLSNNLWNTAQIAMNLDPGKAEWFLNEAVKIDNGNLRAVFDLAEIAYTDGRYPLARDLLLGAREIDPKNVDINMLLALLYMDTGQRELAIKSLERVLAVDRNHPDARALYNQLTR
jgi:tetratricopeptide (TPR) repeat protein